MADKSPDAFRTISEVAAWLETPAHVLRFWESKFPQIKPIKRAGGRRYYRPSDMALIGGIKRLLHDEGMTIKGVQKVLREQGVRHVAALSPPLEDGADLEGAAETPGAEILPFAARVAPAPASYDAPAEAPCDGEATDAPTGTDDAAGVQSPDTADASAAMVENGADAPTADTTVPEDGTLPEDGAGTPPAPAQETARPADAPASKGGADPAAAGGAEPARESALDTPPPAPASASAAGAPQSSAPPGGPLSDAPTADAAPGTTDAGAAPEAPPRQAELFAESPVSAGVPAPRRIPPAPPVHAPRRPVPLRTDVPPDPEDGALEAAPGPLGTLARLRGLRPGAARAMQPHLDALAALHARRADAPRPRH